VPVANDQTASGQVTVVDAMTLGRPLIATRCLGTEEYVIDGQTGLLVEQQSVGALMKAIQRLWADQALRERLGQSAAEFARGHFSNEAIGRALKQVLDSVEIQVRQG